MSAQHTPGPWSLNAPGNICYVNGPQGQYILRRDATQTWDKEASARVIVDCRLIAAAPELLAAFQLFNNDASIGCAASGVYTIAVNGRDLIQMRDAIAKATGVAA